jgi:hypothetical protein
VSFIVQEYLEEEHSETFGCDLNSEYFFLKFTKSKKSKSLRIRHICLLVFFSTAVNPFPHGVLASFCLTAGGLLRPPEEDDISREKTILMT